MREKHKTATDESYRDLSNLPEKLKKHQAFEAEIKANDERLNHLNDVSWAYFLHFKEILPCKLKIFILSLIWF